MVLKALSANGREDYKPIGKIICKICNIILFSLKRLIIRDSFSNNCTRGWGGNTRKQQFQISLEGIEKDVRVLSSRLKGYKRVNSD